MLTDKENANMSEKGWPPTAIKEHWPPVPVKDDTAFYNVNKPPRPDVSAVFKYGSTITVRQSTYGWEWEVTGKLGCDCGFDPWRWLAIRKAKKAVREMSHVANANVSFNY